MTIDDRGDDTGGETVSTLHARWQGILYRLDTRPGCPTPRREARLVEAGRLETQIGRTPARTAGEIILKLRMVLGGRTTALSESALIAGAIDDIQNREE